MVEKQFMCKAGHEAPSLMNGKAWVWTFSSYLFVDVDCGYWIRPGLDEVERVRVVSIVKSRATRIRVIGLTALVIARTRGLEQSGPLGSGLNGEVESVMRRSLHKSTFSQNYSHSPFLWHSIDIGLIMVTARDQFISTQR